MFAYGLANLFREGKSGTDVGDPDRLIAEALVREFLAALRAADHVDGVRVGVVHVRVRHEGVKEGLYGAAGHVGPELAGGEVGDHLLVAHRVPLHKGQDLLELEAGELARLYGREVAPRALDPQDVDLAPGVVALLRLGRRVAAAVVGHGAIPAEQIRAVGQGLQLG